MAAKFAGQDETYHDPNYDPADPNFVQNDPNADYTLNQEDESLVMIRLGDGKVKCLKCGRTASNEHNARRHWSTMHQPNKPERCQICKKMCKNRQARDCHIRRHHGISPKLMKNAIKPPPMNQ